MPPRRHPQCLTADPWTPGRHSTPPPRQITDNWPCCQKGATSCALPCGTTPPKIPAGAYVDRQLPDRDVSRSLRSVPAGLLPSFPLTPFGASWRIGSCMHLSGRGAQGHCSPDCPIRQKATGPVPAKGPIHPGNCGGRLTCVHQGRTRPMPPHRVGTANDGLSKGTRRQSSRMCPERACRHRSVGAPRRILVGCPNGTVR